MSLARASVREIAVVDLHVATPWSGLLRAAPIVAMVIFGLGIGSPRTAVTLAIGGNLVAIVSITAARTSAVLLLGDALGMAAATFVGSSTASNTPLHLSVLAMWCFAAGLLVVLGVGPSTAGVQSVVAFVVFGRFVDSPLGALDLGASVAVGAAIEGGVLLVLRLPPTLRTQRAALSDAFGRLARFARGTATANDASEAFDEAAALLIRPSLFGRTDVGSLKGLVDEGRRMRLEVSALTGFLLRLEAADDSVGARTVREALDRAADRIDHVAEAVTDPSSRRSTGADALGAPSGDLDRRTARASALLDQAFVHLDALDGQARASDHLAHTPVTTHGPRSYSLGRPPGVGEFVAFLRSDLALLRASVTPGSTAFRHAVRLGVAVPIAGILSSALSLPRGYWVAFTVAVVLRPDYSTLFRRGLERVAGTVVGATTAALIVGGLHPGTVATTVLIAGSAWAAYALWPASFPVAMAFVTAFILFLLSTTQVDGIATATDRLIDTVLGGALALGVYALWPTWTERDARQAIGALVAAASAYLQLTLEFIEGRATDPAELAALGRATRIAFANSESSVGRSLDEPRGHRIDPEFGSGVIEATRRIVRATHALRTEAQRGLAATPFPELEALTATIISALGLLAARITSNTHDVVQYPIRPGFARVEEELTARGAASAIALQLDEIIDAVGTLAAVVNAERSSTLPSRL